MGGESALHRLVEVFYASVLVDPLLHPRFGAGPPAHVEFGTEVARQNSWAATDADLHPCQEVPRWSW